MDKATKLAEIENTPFTPDQLTPTDKFEFEIVYTGIVNNAQFALARDSRGKWQMREYRKGKLSGWSPTPGPAEHTVDYAIIAGDKIEVVK